MVIAIDGPAGAGKSTVSKALAERLGFVRVDTGALYRAIALAAVRAGLTPADTDALEALGKRIDLRLTGDEVWLDGEEVGEAIRTPEITAQSSRFAAVPAVRAALLGLQRRLGESHDAVFDGRDIGTVVFPNAEVKIYLTASPEARAERRLAELAERGHTGNQEEVLGEINARDAADRERPIAPLRQAEDAITVDATALDVPAVVEACMKVIEGVLGSR